MKVLQLVPELNAGGVERGTLEVARALVAAGHEAVIVSNGGRLVANLERDGARHLTLPVHRKSLRSLSQVGVLRALFHAEAPDVIHVRSRVPAWLAWLAWRKMDRATRPRLVSTVHGFYSVNLYSKIMTCGERVIAVSESVRDYVLKNYPSVPPARVKVIHRGVSPEEFPRGHRPEQAWLAAWTREMPQLAGARVLLLPGRVTRWKGQEDFLELLRLLKGEGERVHGLIVGETHARRRGFDDELRQRARELGVADNVTFLGHRADIRDVMAASDVVYSLSNDPEAFGRVSLEAMALGVPVVGYDHGGVAEQLRAMFPRGLVKPRDIAAVAARTREILREPSTPAEVPTEFTLRHMTEETLEIYRELVGGV